jgi:hypothetical protein
MSVFCPDHSRKEALTPERWCCINQWSIGAGDASGRSRWSRFLANASRSCYPNKCAYVGIMVEAVAPSTI